MNVVGWGLDTADVLDPYGHLKPGITRVQWFHIYLHIEAGNSYIDAKTLPPLPAGKSAVEVVADYLSRLRQAISAYLEKTLGSRIARNEDIIRYYFTVPNLSSDGSNAAFREAVV